MARGAEARAHTLSFLSLPHTLAMSAQNPIVKSGPKCGKRVSPLKQREQGPSPFISWKRIKNPGAIGSITFGLVYEGDKITGSELKAKWGIAMNTICKMAKECVVVHDILADQGHTSPIPPTEGAEVAAAIAVLEQYYKARQ